MAGSIPAGDNDLKSLPLVLLDGFGDLDLLFDLLRPFFFPCSALGDKERADADE